MILIADKKYEIIENYKDAFDVDVVKDKITDFYDGYDYIVGDWAYGKLRLKGFNENTNKNYNKINDVANVKSYIRDYCAYGCKYFVIKRIKVE